MLGILCSQLQWGFHHYLINYTVFISLSLSLLKIIEDDEPLTQYTTYVGPTYMH